MVVRLILAALYIAALFCGTAWLYGYELRLQAAEQARATQSAQEGR